MRHEDGYGILPPSWFVSETGETGEKSAIRKDDTSDLSRFSRQSRESRLRLRGAPNGLV